MNSQETLIAMAEMVSAKDFENDFSELVESAILTAEMNPISETAEDLKAEMMKALRELR